MRTAMTLPTLMRFAAALMAATLALPASAETWKSVAFKGMSLEAPTWCRMEASSPTSAGCERENESGIEGISLYFGGGPVLKSPSRAQRLAKLEEIVMSFATNDGLILSADLDVPVTRNYFRISPTALPRGADVCIRGEARVTDAGNQLAAEARMITCGALLADAATQALLHVQVMSYGEVGAPVPFPDFENMAKHVLGGVAFRFAE